MAQIAVTLALHLQRSEKNFAWLHGQRLNLIALSPVFFMIHCVNLLVAKSTLKPVSMKENYGIDAHKK